MLIQAYGRFWERDLIDWTSHGWRMLGRRGINTGTIQIADFRKARGVYVLYNEVGPYYVGLSEGTNGIGGRIKDHLKDKHGSLWSRFSWFAFDQPTGPAMSDGVLTVTKTANLKGTSGVAIYELEALLQRAMSPFANVQETQFSAGNVEWKQVATKVLEVRTFDSLKDRL